MKKSLGFVAVYFVPVVAFAHTKWFAAGALAPYQTAEPTTWYLALWGVVALVIVGVGYYLHQQQLFQLAWLQPKTDSAYERAVAAFVMVVGAFLVVAGTHDYLFSPNLVPQAGVPQFLIILQIIIGLTFLLGIATRIAAMVLALVWVVLFFTSGVISAMEDVWVLSTAIFVAIMGNDHFALIGKSFCKKKLEPWKPYALLILRLGTGATLFILGFSEKILAPEYGMNFLAHYHWNFMALLGFPYSDYLFVISAGAVESLFGLIFMLGIMTRLNALAVAVFFSIPLFILGPIELSGHMPHFAAVALLLLYGNGGKFVISRTYKDAKWGDS